VRKFRNLRAIFKTFAAACQFRSELFNVGLHPDKNQNHQMPYTSPQ
jgi:hypothetical protein